MQELEEGEFLGIGAGVGGDAVAQASDVAHSDTVGVMPRAVGADVVEFPAFLDGAVKLDHIVVANLQETALSVPEVDVAGIVVTAFRRGAAMHDDFSDSSHCRGIWCGNDSPFRCWRRRR